MEASPAAPAERPAAALWDRLLSRERLLLLGGVYALELVIFFGAMVIPIDPATKQLLQKTADNLKNLTQGATPGSLAGAIFANNARIGLLEAIPGLGPLVFAFATTTTGQVLQVFAAAEGGPAVIYGALLFLFPYSVVELLGYAIAVEAGTMLVVAWRRKTLGEEARVFVVQVVGVVLVILVAAVMETLTLVWPYGSLALWVPEVLVVLWVWRRIPRAGRPPSGAPPPSS